MRGHKRQLVAVDVVLRGWATGAAPLYEQLETALFGVRGLRTAAYVERSGDAAHIEITFGDKVAATLSAHDCGFAVETTVPKKFREQIKAIEGLSDGVRAALRRPPVRERATIPVTSEEDVGSAAEVIRAKVAFLSR